MAEKLPTGEDTAIYRERGRGIGNTELYQTTMAKRSGGIKPEIKSKHINRARN